MGAIRLVVVDDHGVVRQGLRYALEDAPDIEIVGEASTVAEGLETIERLRPDIALLDVRLPDGSGVDLARWLRDVTPEVRCVMYSAVSSEQAYLQSVVAGAVGYLSKSEDGSSVAAAIRKVVAGDALIDPAVVERLRRRDAPTGDLEDLLRGLTPLEARVLRLVADGATNREIAGQLKLAEKTIRNYVSSILSKLGARNRTQLAVYVARRTAIPEVRERDEGGAGTPGRADPATGPRAS